MKTNNQKTIYFISSSIVPLKDSGGGSVVIYRHLKKFEEEGYNIIFLNFSPSDKRQTEFKQLNISKKKWYPPLRKNTSLFTKIRFQLHLLGLERILKINTNDIILGLLEDYTSYLAFMLARKSNIPFYLFFHDDNIFNRYFNENILTRGQIKKILVSCKCIFVVSEPMKEVVISNGGKHVAVVYPIPDGMFVAKERKLESKKFRFAISGMLLPYFFEKTIEKINFAIEDTDTYLTMIGFFNETYKRSIQYAKRISLYEKFGNLYDLFNFLTKEIDVIIVFYSFDTNEEIRSSYSFPSRFVEFCHLQIPILILAPQSAAISKWALQHSWLSYVDNENKADLVNMINKLKNPDFRKACLEQCRYHAKNDFNPTAIHSQVKRLIEY